MLKSEALKEAIQKAIRELYAQVENLEFAYRVIVMRESILDQKQRQKGAQKRYREKQKQERKAEKH